MNARELRDADLSAFLEGNPFFQSLQPATREALAAAARAHRFAAGEQIFAEQEQSADFYIVLSGSVELRRLRPGSTRGQVVTVRDEGEIFGEMAYLDGTPRSASAFAAEDSVVARFDRERVDDRSGDPLAVMADLGPKFASRIARNLRRTNEEYTAVLTRELDVLQDRQDFGRLFIATSIALGAALIVGQLASEMVIDVRTWQFDWFYLLVLVLPVAVLTLRSRHRLAEFGVNARNALRAVGEALVIAAVVIVLVLVANALFRPWTLGLVLTEPVHPRPVWLMSLYLVHSFLQEFVSRGVLQTSLQRFFSDRTGVKSVVMAAAFFSVLHVHFGITLVVVTFVAGLLFGAVFLRHQTLIGVTLLHFVIGEARYALEHWFV